MDTQGILAELAEVLDQLAAKGDLVLGIAHEQAEMVTWDLSPDQARALAAAFRLAGGGGEGLAGEDPG